MSFEPTELHLKYRPVTFEDMLGQESIAKSVKKQIDDKTTRTFLFTGDSGCGKTSLARVVANYLKTDKQNIIEVDAATYTGIDAIRELTDRLAYKSLGANGVRVLIIDEVHALSKAAFQSLLKFTEEPPPDVYWMLCTTELSKVPVAIKTRCAHYQLNTLPAKTLLELVTSVAEIEDIKLDADSLEAIAEEAYGSPRQALVYLAMSAGCANTGEVRKLIRSAGTNDAVYELSKWLASGKERNWLKASTLLSGMVDLNPESVRIQVTRYILKVALNSKDANASQDALAIIQAFGGQSFNQSDGIAPVVLAVGRIVYSGD